jgi:hypothetical protein
MKSRSASHGPEHAFFCDFVGYEIRVTDLQSTLFFNSVNIVLISPKPEIKGQLSEIVRKK